MLGLSDSDYQPGEAPTPDQQPADVIVSPDTRRSNRIPPGQSRTRKWPVLDAFGTPQIDADRWRLQVFGLVERPLIFTLDEFKALPPRLCAGRLSLRDPLVAAGQSLGRRFHARAA